MSKEKEQKFPTFPTEAKQTLPQNSKNSVAAGCAKQNIYEVLR
jgi:hypothetical protein